MGNVFSQCMNKLPKDAQDKFADITKGDIPGVPGAGGALSQDMIVDAFRSALSEGVEKAVASAMAAGGFSNNQAIRVKLPESLGPVNVNDLRSKLESFGMGDKLDSLENKMNEACEKASEPAKQVFLDAVSNLSVDRARELVKADNQNACTDFMKETCTPGLQGAMSPIVGDAMSSVGCIDEFNNIKDKYNSIPFITKMDFDITDYVVGKGIGGLFQMIGEKETSIRQNPAGAASDAVKQVFSRLGEL